MKKTSFIYTFILGTSLILGVSLQSCNKEKTVKTASVTTTETDSETLGASGIITVNADSISENYEKFQDLKTEIEESVKKEGNSLKYKAKKLQEDMIAAQKKAQSGQLSVQEIQKMQTDFQRREQNLALSEQKSQEKIMNLNQKMMDSTRTIINTELEVLRKKYNAQIVITLPLAGGLIALDTSIDKTQEVINLLNAKYDKEKTK